LDAATEIGEEWVERLAAEPNADPSFKMESLQNTHVLLAAVYALPQEQREAFLMQAEGELSVEEIATAMGVNFETAKSRLRYARTRLKQVLQEHV
jgi:RNA polymerase sigma-70 factor (ECF subfamily)